MERRWARNRMVMGLPFSIHLRGQFEQAAAEAAVAEVWRELEEVDRIFSTYREDSDISLINAGRLTPDGAHPEVSVVLDLAEHARLLTGGAFDVRFSGLLDPSGVVKGWAAERAADHLLNLGCDFYLNAGGDILAAATDPARPWVLGIEHPTVAGALLAVVSLGNGALATSGSNHRGDHIIDPASGLPQTRVRQVSVIGPTLLWADILATAATVGGPDSIPAGNWLADHEALFVGVDGTVCATTGLTDLLAAGQIAPVIDRIIPPSGGKVATDGVTATGGTFLRCDWLVTGQT